MKFPSDELGILKEKQAKQKQKISGLKDQKKGLLEEYQSKESESGINVQNTEQASPSQEKSRALSKQYEGAVKDLARFEKIKTMFVSDGAIGNLYFICGVVAVGLLFLVIDANTGSVACRDGTEEISFMDVRDGEKDCPDGSDEENLTSELSDAYWADERYDQAWFWFCCVLWWLVPTIFLLFHTTYFTENRKRKQIQVVDDFEKRIRYERSETQRHSHTKKRMNEIQTRLDEIENVELPLAQIELESVEKTLAMFDGLVENRD